MSLNYYQILVASQRYHGQESLTYKSDSSLKTGQIVSVPLQRITVLGIVASKVPQPKFNLKPIVSAWSLYVPSQSLQLLFWLQTYYPGPLGMITELFTPPALRKQMDPARPLVAPQHSPVLPALTEEQKNVVDAITSHTSQSILLHGNTGSGKTRVYLEIALRTVQAGRSVMILTPEIGLTKQLLDSFANVFGEQVVITHSKMTAAERRRTWQQIAGADKPVIIIGPRSAVFSPVNNLGLLVMDEAHDTAYKQEQSPYYQTSRVAAQLAHFHSARFIMGSATPSLSDYFTFTQKKLPILGMHKHAIALTHTTTHHIIDCRDKALFSRSPWLANPLLRAMDQALEKQQQALLFLNRRGSARLVLCDACGWQSMCPHCDVALTYHQDQHLMRCHSCNFSGITPTSCPSCKATNLLFKSIGTKALEAEIERLYPGASIARFDRDTLKAKQLSIQLQDLQTGKIDIIIGTQSIAKGFDLPKLSVVGIVQADSGLQIPDYSSNERTYQLISQVSGRVGRGHVPGKLFIQSYQPDSPLISYALGRNYPDFYAQELQERKQYRFPPYFFLLKVSCVRASSNTAQKACDNIVVTLQQAYSNIIIEGPTPRFIEKISGKFAWHIVIKAQSRATLLKVIKKLPSNCTYDIDPNDLL